MDARVVEPAGTTRRLARQGPAFGILAAISVSHLLNDLIQSLLPATYPILKSAFQLDFGQIGLVTLTFQLSASLLQPLVGFYTDRRSSPYSLPVGMGSSLCGLLLLAFSTSFASLLLAAALVGVGSSIFHPESSRVARMASGGRPGLAQSIFQVGGNAGAALGPLLVAIIVVPRGQGSIAWFSLAALLAVTVLLGVSRWYRTRAADIVRARKAAAPEARTLSRPRVASAILVLLILIFSKNFYTASLNNYYTFYLIDRFHLSVQQSQVYLFLYLGSIAAGSMIGGPLGDRFGRKYIIWFSVLGALPFALALPYANLIGTALLTVAVGMIMASSLPAIIVYAQELVPSRIGMISGLFYGFAFGMGGVGAAVFGEVADLTSIDHVYRLCSYLPALGIVAAVLPDLRKSPA